MLDDEANGAALADAASDAAPVSEAPETTPLDTMSEIAAKYYPARDGSGRFAAREEPAADAAPDEAAPAATETTDQPEQPAAETAPPAPSIEPPAAWSADAKAKWAAVPPDVQQIIAAREAEAHKAITQTGERLKGYEALEQVIGPRRDALRASWGNEGAAIQQLFQLSDFATRDPSGFVHWFAQQNNVDLSRLTSATAAAPADPQVAALRHELSTVRSTIEQQQAAQMESSITAFATAKDGAGNPLRPHFEAVRADMGKLMQAGIATTLEDAYARAIRINEAVWSQVQADEAAARAKAAQAEETKRREAQAKAAAEAKRAASVNVRAVGAVSGSPVTPATPRETMEAVARKYFGSAA